MSVRPSATTPIGLPVHGRELVKPLTSIRTVPVLHRATTYAVPRTSTVPVTRRALAAASYDVTSATSPDRKSGSLNRGGNSDGFGVDDPRPRWLSANAAPAAASAKTTSPIRSRRTPRAGSSEFGDRVG